MASTLIVLVAALVAVESATVAPSGTCKTSYDCGTGMCCVAQDGTILTNQEMGGFGPLFPDSQHVSGTCTLQKAQKGDICDNHCQCDTGLLCYRPVSGVCCPPMRCYDEAYVHQQQAYWNHCNQDPNCFPPP